MPDQSSVNENRLEKAFLNERFMAAACVFMAAVGIVSLVFASWSRMLLTYLPS